MTHKSRTDLPDDTGSKQGKQALTRFQPGQSGNPKGRPKGARSRLSESFLDDLMAEWETSGRQALAQCATKEPTQFIKVVANVLPREVLVRAFSASISVDLSDLADAQNFLAAYQAVKAAPLVDEGALITEAWRHDD